MTFFESPGITDRIVHTRRHIAQFLGADPEGSALVPNATAGVSIVLRSVRLQPADEVLLTDGPFAEAKEYVAGIDFVEAADLDEAIALAAEHPAAADGGSVEVRPVWE